MLAERAVERRGDPHLPSRCLGCKRPRALWAGARPVQLWPQLGTQGGGIDRDAASGRLAAGGGRDQGTPALSLCLASAPPTKAKAPGWFCPRAPAPGSRNGLPLTPLGRVQSSPSSCVGGRGFPTPRLHSCRWSLCKLSSVSHRSRPPVSFCIPTNNGPTPSCSHHYPLKIKSLFHLFLTRVSASARPPVSSSQSVAWDQSPGSLLGVKISGCHPRPTESDARRVAQPPGSPWHVVPGA